MVEFFFERVACHPIVGICGNISQSGEGRLYGKALVSILVHGGTMTAS